MGRDKKNEKLPGFTPLIHYTMQTPAWKALSVYAKALYPELKRRAGIHGAKNGAFFMAVREVAEYLGCDKNTASKALHDLQRKGFLVPVQIGHLGIEGVGKATIWRLTELGVVGKSQPPTKEYMRWNPAAEFPVQMGKRPAQKQDPV